MNERIAAARSLLFVPGHRPDRFAKAAVSGADVVVLDLEDAVDADHKAAARRHVRGYLAAGHQVVVRINAPGTSWFHDDMAAVGQLAAAVMVPKADDPEVLGAVAGLLPNGAGLIPLIETATGILHAHAVCDVPSVVRPAFGSVDLAAQLGVDHRSAVALRHARASVVLAAAAAGRAAPIDGVTTALVDDVAVDADIREAIALGFTGKLCVHPHQVDIVNRAFTPATADVEWARSVIAASADGSVAVHEGQMIDRPVILRAKNILGRAGNVRCPMHGDTVRAE
jgi:citrate lyase subunit beta/citryl-CoA lyase